MVVRIRFSQRSVVDKIPRPDRRAALALAALLDPAAFITFSLGLWGVAAELKWVQSFAIPSGLFSHWEIWLGGAAALELCAVALNRYGKSGGSRLIS